MFRIAFLLGICILAPEILCARLSNLGKVRAPEPPKFPNVFTAKYTFSMPYYITQQPEGLSFEVQLWFDGKNDKLRIDSLNGLDKVYFIKWAEYDVHPRIDKLTCMRFGGNAGSSMLSRSSPLPDLGDWEYAGETKLHDKTAQIWQYQYKYMEKTESYTFYVTEDGQPLKLHMLGVNVITDSHMDEYVYDFHEFLTAEIDDAVFEPPCELCGTSEAESPRPLLGAIRARAMIPAIWKTNPSEAAYHMFASSNGRQHTSLEEYNTRLARFQQVSAQIQAHNANPASTYKMKLNRYADWSDEEFFSLMTPARLSKETESAAQREVRSPSLGTFTGSGLGKAKLPRNVDWRGTGADAGVKDQGMCGSCWSFGATSAMEGAWFLATGEKRSFSEQQIIDCSWDYGPKGCDGGNYDDAIYYVAKNGGLAIEQDYQYKSGVQYCGAANHTRVGQFSGYMRIKSRDEEAVMEAVATLGPLAVAVDAEFESFRFYGEGVYIEPKCSAHSLDHAVILMGYGTTESGIDYWLVKNTWTRLYGEDGYIRIIRGKQDCGISTDVVAAVVDQQFVVPGVADRVRIVASK